MKYQLYQYMLQMSYPILRSLTYDIDSITLVAILQKMPILYGISNIADMIYLMLPISDTNHRLIPILIFETLRKSKLRGVKDSK